MPRRSGQRSTTSPARSRGAAVESIFISPSNAAPMRSVKTATLIAGVGIEGDRYELKTGTYSAKFLYEPGRNLTLVSADGFDAQVAKTKMEPLHMSALRRNIVVRGISAEAVNAMVGHEVAVGSARLFVHRLTVPCRYRQAQCKRCLLYTSPSPRD